MYALRKVKKSEESTMPSPLKSPAGVVGMLNEVVAVPGTPEYSEET